MNEDDNAYEILGVPRTATRAEIKMAYIKLCREFHPDRGTSEKDIQRRTLKMFAFNAAKDILMDEAKRKEHDEFLNDREQGGTGDRHEQGQGFADTSENPTFRRPKPRPSGLGVPYTCSETTCYTCYTDGMDGEDAIDGRRGSDGDWKGGHGTDGSDASPASEGAHARDMEIRMRVGVHEGGYFEVDIQHFRGMGEIVDLSRSDNFKSIPLKAFGTLDWSAKGGKGGNGGRGGDGGNGMFTFQSFVSWPGTCTLLTNFVFVVFAP